MDAVTKYLYDKLKELIAIQGYSISIASDGKYMLGTGSGLFLEADTLIEVLDYAVEKSTEQFRSNRDELNRRVLIELGVPAEIIK